MRPPPTLPDPCRVPHRPLDSTISLQRTLHLLLYLPSQDVTPLMILDRNGEPLSPPGAPPPISPLSSTNPSFDPWKVGRVPRAEAAIACNLWGTCGGLACCEARAAKAPAPCVSCVAGAAFTVGGYGAVHVLSDAALLSPSSDGGDCNHHVERPWCLRVLARRHAGLQAGMVPRSAPRSALGPCPRGLVARGWAALPLYG